ncbi:tetratricopeptide repeat protein 27 [Planococcus citri]|uniref:tetratricopeptide repeat protein 27 n=1 Tax=Planococcus citri TaxID=170843 RepID=UPI0031F9E76F
MELTAVETSLLTYPLNISDTNGGKFNSGLVDGKYSEIIESFLTDVFHQDATSCANIFNVADPFQYLKSAIENFISKTGEQNYNETDILIVGIASLYHFVQYNWTGPVDPKEDDKFLKFLTKGSDSESRNVNEIKKHILEYLNTDDDTISPTTREPFLLLLAELIFRSSIKLSSKKWWLMRSLYIRQSLLSDPSPALHQELTSLVSSLEDQFRSDDSHLKIFLHLESVQISLQLYSEISKVQPWLDQVHRSLHLQASLVGALGKRTRFQERDIAQLTLKVDSVLSGFLDGGDVNATSLPKDLRLDDEVRLPEIRFTDEDVTKFPSLNGIQQSAIMASFVLMKKSKPKDKLQLEELSPYLNCLLSQPKVWCLQMAALLFRSRLEAECSRTIERSITQIQSLITDLESGEPAIIERIPFIFCSYMVPKWKLETELAKLLVEVGAIQSALDIYLHLQMWEEIVACYNYLKLQHKAAEVIRQEMTKQESVKLWCLLGDATDDETCYQKAWELSKCKSSRAQKHWALYYFQKKRYQESIPHFQKSLEINSLQIPLWFNLGYAAMDQENWEVCASAYRRYCSLEADCFEAWNNLAKAYVKLGQKDRAWRALQEAVKCNYDNWMVWDNLMAVSTDCADFEEVIRCYHRLLDLRGKHVDVEVLRILVKGIGLVQVCNDVVSLREQALKLFGRLTSLVLNNAEIWKLYADLVATKESKTSDDYLKMINNLQKAYRVATQDPGWESTIEECTKVMSWCAELVEVQAAFHSVAPEAQALQQLNSVKLILRSLLAKIKNAHTDALDQLNEALVDDVSNLESKLSSIESQLSKSSS